MLTGKRAIQGRKLEEIRVEQTDDLDPPSEAAENNAKERVRLMLILKKIAGIEGIEVDDDALDSRIETMAGEYHLTPAQLRADLEEKGSLQRLSAFLLAEKTLDFLLRANHRK